MTYIQDYSINKIPYSGVFDSEGIPLFDPKSMGWQGELCYHPTVVVQYGLACWERRNHGYGNSFKLCAEWLLNHADIFKGDGMVWYIPFSIRTPKVEAPWISALTQAQAISLLLRYRNLYPSDELELCIHGAAKSMLIPHENGGLLFENAKGEFFFEEASDIHILNGCLTSLFGLVEYLNVFDDENIAKIVKRVTKTVETWMSDYDTGFWSRYSKNLRFNLADLHYHQLHIQQLNTLGFLLGNNVFLGFARKWKRYSLSPLNVQMFIICRFLGLNTMRLLTLLRLNKLKFRQ